MSPRKPNWTLALATFWLAILITARFTSTAAAQPIADLTSSIDAQQDGEPAAAATQETPTIQDAAAAKTDDSAKAADEPRAPLPSAYLLSAEFKAAVDNLQRHGVKVEELREDVELDVEASRIGKITHADASVDGHRLTSLEVQSEPRGRSFPPGTFVVRTAQPLARLASLLLDAQSEDGLTAWNFFDDQLKEGGEYPVFRLPAGQTMLTIATRPLEKGRAHDRRVTFETLYGKPNDRVEFAPPTTRVEWLPDGKQFLQTREGKLYKVDAITGRSTRYPDPARLAKSLAAIPSLDAARRRTISEQANFTWNPDRTAALIVNGDDLYQLPTDGSPALRLTRTRGEKKFAQYSPDGQFVAYVRDHNLYVTDVATQSELAITADSDPKVLNGEASWVYMEEVFGRGSAGRAFWWSPDSRHLAFCRFDETGMQTFHAVDTIPLHDEVFSMAHPKPGDPNPAVSLGVAHVAGGPVKWVDLSDYIAGSFIITNVDWRAGGDLMYFYVQDRAQTWLDFRTCGPNDTKSERVFRETTKAWVANPGDAWWAKDEIILLSERSGWKHLYAYNTKTKKWRPITHGDWEIRSVDRVDAEAGWIYFTACERSPIATDWYRVHLDGTGQERLTERAGSHRVDLAPKGNLAVDSWSAFQSAGNTTLINTDGQTVRTIDSRPSFKLEEFKLGEFRHLQIPTDDGFQLEATVTLPPDYDAEKKYPVWFTTYGGPHAPQVRDAGGPQMQQQMWANAGIIVFVLDPRSASGKGAQSTWTAYRQLGVGEMKDIECGINWLIKNYPVDASRIGMSGHSYGGFMTAYALTHSKLFSAGIAGAPVTDWRNYDSIYTERYMNTPQENPVGYEETSVVKAAAKLHGKLLLLHGLADENVHLQNSTQFMQALQRANKDFEVMFYPQQHHGIRGDHYNHLLFDFIKRSLELDKDTNPKR